MLNVQELDFLTWKPVDSFCVPLRRTDSRVNTVTRRVTSEPAAFGGMSS